jgi:hypothetical protein
VAVELRQARFLRIGHDGETHREPVGFDVVPQTQILDDGKQALLQRVIDERAQHRVGFAESHRRASKHTDRNRHAKPDSWLEYFHLTPSRFPGVV